jgi:hypothetical protein
MTMRKTTATLAHPSSVTTGNKLGPADTCCSFIRPEKRRAITLDDIRLRAYSKWEAAGKPDGDGSRFWLAAEAELLQEK